MNRSGIDIHIPFAEHLGVRLLSQGTVALRSNWR